MIRELPAPECKSRKEMVDRLYGLIAELRKEECTYLEIHYKTREGEKSITMLGDVFQCRPKKNG